MRDAAEQCSVGAPWERHTHDIGITQGGRPLKETEDSSGAPEPKEQQDLCLLRPPTTRVMDGSMDKAPLWIQGAPGASKCWWMLSPASSAGGCSPQHPGHTRHNSGSQLGIVFVSVLGLGTEKNRKVFKCSISG